MRLLHDRRHRPRCRRASAGSLLAPRSPIDVGAHGAVGDLRADVDGELAAVEHVEVLGEALPVPGHALGERGAGDVLHALHELDEPLLLAGAHRGEAHAAVAGDDGGDAVAGGRVEHVVPGGLAVVVGVDVDEAGRDQHARRRRRSRPPRRRATAPTADDLAVLDRDVARRASARRCRRRSSRCG